MSADPLVIALTVCWGWVAVWALLLRRRIPLRSPVMGWYMVLTWGGTFLVGSVVARSGLLLFMAAGVLVAEGIETLFIRPQRREIAQPAAGTETTMTGIRSLLLRLRALLAAALAAVWLMALAVILVDAAGIAQGILIGAFCSLLVVVSMLSWWYFNRERLAEVGFRW